ncbi:MAG: AbrB/MazE/SpoVT family DNA-binding domain-containing protein [Candidatus Bathyarchaeia archaeon]
MLEVFEARISSKGQMVIPKPLRERYNLRKGSRLRLIASDEGIIIKPIESPPWTGLRGIVAEEWSDIDLDTLIDEAKKSLHVKG